MKYLLILSLVLTGCVGQRVFENEAARVKQNIADQSKALTLVLTTVNGFYAAGIIDNDDKKQLEPIVDQLVLSLDNATTKAQLGDIAGAEAELNVFTRLNKILDALVEEMANERTGNSTPSTSLDNYRRGYQFHTLKMAV